MFSYSPQVADRSGEIMAAGQVGAANTQAEMYNQLGNNIGGALTAIGQMYGKYKDKKDMLAGMDQAVMGMSDIGAVTPDFRDKYLNADKSTRPFLFEALVSPMFKAYNAGQAAAAQAQAWDKYRGGEGGGMPMGGAGFFTY
jgi:hypothetical protein